MNYTLICTAPSLKLRRRIVCINEVFVKKSYIYSRLIHVNWFNDKLYIIIILDLYILNIVEQYENFIDKLLYELKNNILGGKANDWYSKMVQF